MYSLRLYGSIYLCTIFTIAAMPPSARPIHRTVARHGAPRHLSVRPAVVLDAGNRRAWRRTAVFHVSLRSGSPHCACGSVLERLSPPNHARNNLCYFPCYYFFIHYVHTQPERELLNWFAHAIVQCSRVCVCVFGSPRTPLYVCVSSVAAIWQSVASVLRVYSMPLHRNSIHLFTNARNREGLGSLDRNASAH